MYEYVSSVHVLLKPREPGFGAQRGVVGKCGVVRRHAFASGSRVHQQIGRRVVRRFQLKAR